MIFPSWTKTEPMGIPPSDSLLRACSIAASRNGSRMSVSYGVRQDGLARCRRRGRGCFSQDVVAAGEGIHIAERKDGETLPSFSAGVPVHEYTRLGEDSFALED